MTAVEPAKPRRKPGPRPCPARAFNRELFPEWSDRTFSTYWTAWCTLAELGMETGDSRSYLKEAVKAATRPNGSFNVSKFARIAEVRAIQYVLAQEAVTS